MTYAEKLRDPRWQKKRLAIMERDEFKCRDCNADDLTLHVHHCLYQKGNPWDTEDRFLLTLCDGCHENRQAYENETKKALGEIFSLCDWRSLDSIQRTVFLIRDIKLNGDLAEITVNLVAPEEANHGR